MLRASSPIATIKGSLTVWTELCYLSHWHPQTCLKLPTATPRAALLKPSIHWHLQSCRHDIQLSETMLTLFKLDQYTFCWSCLQERSLPDSRAVRNGKPTSSKEWEKDKCGAKLWRSHASASIVQLLSVGLRFSWNGISAQRGEKRILNRIIRNMRKISKAVTSRIPKTFAINSDTRSPTCITLATR